MKNIYYVINTTDLNKIDFQEIVGNINTIRYSLDGSKFIIKTPIGFEGDPSFISNGSVVPVGTYTHSEIITELQGVEWVEVIE